MSDKISHLKKLMSEASGKIMESSAANISAWLGENFLPEWAVDALVELFEEGRYEEIDDRFFRFLAFGTGGMRGRTIGKSPAMAELGRQSEQGTPEHAAVGANNMNDFNVVRATMGLFNYCKSHLGAAESRNSPLPTTCATFPRGSGSSLPPFGRAWAARRTYSIPPAPHPSCLSPSAA